MVRGRIGGGGRAFNVGEMTVTRCTIRLNLTPERPDGDILGHGYVAGRKQRQAELAAVIDGVCQADLEVRARAETMLVDPVLAREAARTAKVRTESDATKVDFFTMVRGTDQVLTPGFTDPVFEAQAAFRAALDALATPGRGVQLAGPQARPPAVQGPAAALCLALCDLDTPLWVGGDGASDVAHYLTFHTGAGIVSDPADAVFALALDAAALPAIDRFRIGDADYPDQSATILIQVPDLWRGPIGRSRRARCGDSRDHCPRGTADSVLGTVAAESRCYPLGVDAFLVGPTQIVGLPRSVSATAAAKAEA